MRTFRIISNHMAAQWPAPWTSADYWLAHTLGEAMTDAGGRMVLGDADVTVYTWGWVNVPVDPTQNNVLWVVGHPAALLDVLSRQRREMLAAFKRFFCASKRFCATLKREHGVDATWLVHPPPDRPELPAVGPAYDVAFVGNADPAKSRPMLASLFETYHSAVYGGGWSALAPSAMKGEYVRYPDLAAVWRSARLVPATQHADMAEHGFVNGTALDSARHGPLVLSHAAAGWSDIGVTVPQFETEPQMHALARRYLADPVAAADLAAKHREDAAQYTFAHAAETLLCS